MINHVFICFLSLQFKHYDLSYIHLYSSPSPPIRKMENQVSMQHGLRTSLGFKRLKDDISNSGMLCKLCRKHNNQKSQRVRQGCAVWVGVPCFNYKQDALKEHKTYHHNAAVNMKAQIGLMRAERKAFIGHLKCMYWLIKAEVSHTPLTLSH